MKNEIVTMLTDLSFHGSFTTLGITPCTIFNRHE